MPYLLDGIRVVDAASYLAGPGAATVLADFGADVIKVEPPGGDGYRQLAGNYPVAYHWQLTSRNKRSIALDISTAQGQDILHKLVQGADVIIVNFLEPQLRRYRLTYQELKAINPRIVFAQMTGYGTEGPEVERKGFDVTAWWARSGLMDFIRDRGQTPMGPAPGMGDHSTAMSMYGAIMTGLYRRERTGVGCQVSTSLAANGVWANGMSMQGVIAGLDLGAYKQERGWQNPFTSTYATADGRFVVLAMLNQRREWPKLARALDHPEWLQDERFSDLGKIMKHRRALIAAIGDAVQQYTQHDLMQRLDDHGVTCGVVAPMGDVVEDEQMRASGIVVETGDPGEDYRYTVNSPFAVQEEQKRPPSRAPDIGAHTREIMRETGFDDAAIEALLASGVLVAKEG